MNRLFRGYVQRRFQVVPVGTAVAREAGKHQAQAVQQLGQGSESAPDARHTGALVQSQRRGDVAHVVGHRARCLGHPAAGIGGKGFQIAAGALGIQHSQRQGRLSGAGNTGDPDNLPERDIHI